MLKVRSRFATLPKLIQIRILLKDISGFFLKGLSRIRISATVRFLAMVRPIRLGLIRVRFFSTVRTGSGFSQGQVRIFYFLKRWIPIRNSYPVSSEGFDPDPQLCYGEMCRHGSFNPLESEPDLIFFTVRSGTGQIRIFFSSKRLFPDPHVCYIEMVGHGSPWF